MEQHTEDKAAAAYTVSRGERLSYGAGAVGYQLPSMLIGGFLSIYLTNVVLLDIAAVSIIIALSKVMDGISDVIIGNIIDNSSSRFGKARVWLLRMCIPFYVSVVLLFMVPPGFSQMAKYIYVFLMYNIANTVFYTFLQIAHYSMISFMTPDRIQQGLLGNVQSFFKTVTAVFGQAVFVKLLLVFTSEPGNQNTQRAYTCTVGILCLIAIACTAICFLGTKERVEESIAAGEMMETESRLKLFGRALKELVKDKFWVIMILTQIFHFISVQICQSGGVYYSLYVLGDMGYVGMLTASLLAPSVGAQMLSYVLIKKIGKLKIFYLGTVLCVIGGIGFGLASPNIHIMIPFNILKGIGTGFYNSMVLGIVADIISYTRRKTGLFLAGMGNAGVSMANKLGQGLSNVLLGTALSLAGFNGALKVQPPAVGEMTTFIYVWIPLFIDIIICFVFIRFFDLDKQMKD